MIDQEKYKKEKIMMQDILALRRENCWTAAVQYSGQAKDAYVCGTFSNWKKIPMVKSQKDFVALIGEHRFSF